MAKGGRPENLKPFKKGEKRASEAGKKGGKAKAQKDRARLNMKEQLEILWNLPLYDEGEENMKGDKMGECLDITDIKTFSEVSGQNQEAGMAGLTRLMQRWINKGDPKDGEFISKILGLYIQKTEVEGSGMPIVIRNNVPNPFEGKTPKEIKQKD